jgi:hypothetical protein
MSNALAIAAVTRTLRAVITRAVLESVPVNTPSDVQLVNQIQVTTLPLDKVREVNQNGNVVNLFLYSATPNAALRNLSFSRMSGGSSGVDSQLALSLHYMVSVYGQDNNELLSHLLLGRAMLALHDNALLMPADLNDALAASGLQDQVERVRITPHPLNFEEMSKLWMAFQTVYRVSAAYEVSAVLIDSARPQRAAPPVRVANISVATFSVPTIDRVDPQIAPAGATLRITGTNLGDPSTQVRLGSLLVTPSSSADSELSFALPPSLSAGVNTLQVVQERALGVPPVPHPGVGFQSNVAAFVLSPQITTVPPITVARGAALTISVSPAVRSDQRLAVLIGDQVLLAPPRAASDPPSSNTVSVALPADFATGTFLLRVQVDGAASPLVTDTNAASPTFNQYVGPTVTVT